MTFQSTLSADLLMSSPAILLELRQTLASAATGSAGRRTARMLASVATVTADSVSILGTTQADDGVVLVRFAVLAGDAHDGDSSTAAAAITEALQAAFLDGRLARLLASQPLLSQIVTGRITLSDFQTLAVALGSPSSSPNTRHALAKEEDRSSAFALAGIAIASILMMAVALWVRGRFARSQPASPPSASPRVKSNSLAATGEAAQQRSSDLEAN